MQSLCTRMHVCRSYQGDQEDPESITKGNMLYLHLLQNTHDSGELTAPDGNTVDLMKIFAHNILLLFDCYCLLLNVSLVMHLTVSIVQYIIVIYN